MYKEGHRRKTFKRRYFVVWPRDYQELSMDAPVLFYYDSDKDGEVRTPGCPTLTDARPKINAPPTVVEKGSY